MVAFSDISESGFIARVKAKSEDNKTVYLEFRNDRKIVTVTLDQPLEFKTGSIIFIQPENNHIERAPDELWPEESWVGVVRLKLDDLTVLSSNGMWKHVPTNNTIYEVGNTVEARDSSGVLRVLSEEPINRFDIPSVHKSGVSRFKIEDDRNLSFDDFGGLESVVKRAQELVELPLSKPEHLRKIGARPIKGVLFTGKPGTGKTMLARIIANSTDATFYLISGPQLFSKWYGESEKIMRELFTTASKQNKSIIFFDEIDSVASQRADESHEASRRVVAQLLTLMDGFTREDNVIVIGASNRPQDIDKALLRPGRFDWKIKFPLPNRQDREKILKASSRKICTSGQLPHIWMSRNTENWAASDLTAIWSEAAILAASENRSTILPEDYIGGFQRVSDMRS